MKMKPLFPCAEPKRRFRKSHRGLPKRRAKPPTVELLIPKDFESDYGFQLETVVHILRRLKGDLFEGVIDRRLPMLTLALWKEEFVKGALVKKALSSLENLKAQIGSLRDSGSGYEEILELEDREFRLRAALLSAEYLAIKPVEHFKNRKEDDDELEASSG